MWKVDNKKRDKLPKMVSKNRKYWNDYSTPKPSGIPQECSNHCCLWSRWPNCSSSSLLPSSKSNPSFSPSRLYQTICLSISVPISSRLHRSSLQIFLPNLLLSHPSSTPNAWRNSLETPQLRLPEKKAGHQSRKASFVSSFPIFSVMSNPQVSFPSM